MAIGATEAEFVTLIMYYKYGIHRKCYQRNYTFINIDASQLIKTCMRFINISLSARSTNETRSSLHAACGLFGTTRKY